MGIEERLLHNKSHYNELAKQGKKKLARLSWSRLTAFLLSLIIAIQGLSSTFTVIHLVSFLACLIVFIGLIAFYKKQEIQYYTHQELSNINAEELDRKGLNLSHFPEGSEFLDESHPYAYDLDIFGRHSIFQLLNRTILDHSKALLAKWLLHHENKSVIEKRQQAIQELVQKLDFMQQVSAAARVTFRKSKEDLESQLDNIFQWMGEKSEDVNILLYRLLAYTLTTINIGLIILAIINPSLYSLPLLSIFISLMLLGIVLNQAKALGENLNTSSHIIEAYANILEKIENEPFENPSLKSLKNSLYDNDKKASAKIKQLKKIVFWFSARASMFYALLDGIFLIDFHLVNAAHIWKKQNAKHIHQWTDAVHELEALASLAGFFALNEDYIFPSFSDKGFTITTTQVGHPLIPTEQCVRNDFSSEGEGNVIVITGSNMSGKSTFERTLGVNMVLAQIGAPVFAEKLEMSPTTVFTSMRTKDNLEESTSSFYAELKRIRQLLDHTDKNESTFYVLDEILKGTNSDDRHKGAVALANQLSNKRTFGLISTHDLALSALSEENPRVANFSFNSVIEDDEIIFDYLLTPGPCKSFNASKLMEKMGIDILDA